jgi:uncharacterized membrane protein HdeD (DUF308 family)
MFIEPQFGQNFDLFMINLFSPDMESFHNIYIHSITKYKSMKDDTTREIIAIIAIILGVLMLIYPQLVGYLAGLFLIIYGILELIK